MSDQKRANAMLAQLRYPLISAVTQWLRASNIFRQICQSTSEWRGFGSRWFCRSGFEFTKAQLSILKH